MYVFQLSAESWQVTGSSVQFPEIAGQPKLPEQRMSFVHRAAAPVGIAPILIPLARQRPADCRREYRSAGETPGVAPAT